MAYSPTGYIGPGAYRAYLKLALVTTEGAATVKGTGGASLRNVDGWNGSEITAPGGYHFVGNCYALDYQDNTWLKTNWWWEGFNIATVTRTHKKQTKTYTMYLNVGGAGLVQVSASIDIPAKSSYAVKYNANGGSGAPAAQTKWYGETLTLSKTKPTRSGYDFVGWATSANGAAAYQPGGNYTTNAAVTLYAVWAQTSYTVSYNAQGGTGAPAAQTKYKGVNLTLSSTVPTKDGYVFQGWATSAGGAVAYQPGGTYSTDAAVTLYAVWTTGTYTISYDANGGTGAPDSQTKTFGVDLTLSSTVPTKTSYTFIGWGESTTGGATYAAGGTYTKNESKTLYALWEPTHPLDLSVSDPVTLQQSTTPVEVSWTGTAGTNYQFEFQVNGEQLLPSPYYEMIEADTTGTNTHTFDLPAGIGSAFPNDMSVDVLCAVTEQGTLVEDTTFFTVNVPATGTMDFDVTLRTKVHPLDGTETEIEPVDPPDVSMEIVRRAQEFHVDVANIAETYGATLENYAHLELVKGSNRRSYDEYIIDGAVSFPVEPLKWLGEVTANISVTNSRGQTLTKTYIIQVDDYAYPQVDFKLIRREDVDKLFVKADITWYGSAFRTDDIYWKIDVKNMNGTTVATYPTDGWNWFENEESAEAFTETVCHTFELANLNKKNYEFVVRVDDQYADGYSKSQRFRRYTGDRFDELSENDFYVNINALGWKHETENYSGATIDDEKIVFERVNFADTDAYNGVPVLMEEKTEYEIWYGVNRTDYNMVCVSFFDEEFEYISTYPIYITEILHPGDRFTTPEGTAWGLVLFGVAPGEDDDEDYDGYRVFTDIAIRPAADPEDVPVKWMMETGTLGLDTPRQKYISRVQLRMDLLGTFKAEIAYDDGEWETVLEKEQKNMSSTTIPINVKRCDHFKMRLSGEGQIRIYSFGYVTDEGSERCLL